jgi:hypothetical protein
MRRAHLTFVLVGLALICWRASAGQAEPQRVALVISNGQYGSLPAIARCAASAAAVRDALRATGYDVIERNNLGRGQFDTAIGLLARRAAASQPAVAALYYCGYAVDFNGRPFLLPTSATLARDHDVLTQGILAKSIVDSLRREPESAGFVVLDVFPPANAGVARLGRLADQIPASRFAVVAASNDGPGEGPTTAALAVGDALAAGDLTVDGLVNGLRRRLAKDAGVTAQFIDPIGDAAFAAGGRRAPQAAVAPPPSPAPSPEPPLKTPAAAPPTPPPQAMPDEDQMTEQDRRKVQTVLATMGYYAGRIDATFGPETRAAIRRYQFEIKAELTGRLTAEQATRLVNSVR